MCFSRAREFIGAEFRIRHFFIIRVASSPDSVFAEIEERPFGKLVSYGLFRASSVSHSILFHSVLFSS